MRVRDAAGRFSRLHLPWTLSRFDDGYVDGSSRMRVYLPTHPRSSESGYVMRSIVAYEAYHPGETMTPDFVVHHKNENRQDDSPENLERQPFGLHSSNHNRGRGLGLASRACKGCGCTFSIKIWRLRDSSRGQYCSQACYHEQPRRRWGQPPVALKCEWCTKAFIVRATVLKNKPGFGRFCSHSCSANARWAKCA